jgi:hypothetical protein
VAFLILVEPGGIEPPSANPLRPDLHVYLIYFYLSCGLANQQADHNPVTLVLAAAQVTRSTRDLELMTLQLGSFPLSPRLPAACCNALSN